MLQPEIFGLCVEAQHHLFGTTYDVVAATAAAAAGSAAAALDPQVHHTARPKLLIMKFDEGWHVQRGFWITNNSCGAWLLRADLYAAAASRFTLTAAQGVVPQVPVFQHTCHY